MENTSNTTPQPEAVAPTTPVAATPAPVVNKVESPAVSKVEPPKVVAPAVPTELPKTTGKTPGGWNRFAGYNPNANKDKQGKRDKDRGRGPRNRG